MRKRTTTKQLHNALSNNLLTVERAESYNKTVWISSVRQSFLMLSVGIMRITVMTAVIT